MAGWCASRAGVLPPPITFPHGGQKHSHIPLVLKAALPLPPVGLYSGRWCTRVLCTVRTCLLFLFPLPAVSSSRTPSCRTLTSSNIDSTSIYRHLPTKIRFGLRRNIQYWGRLSPTSTHSLLSYCTGYRSESPPEVWWFQRSGRVRQHQHHGTWFSLNTKKHPVFCKTGISSEASTHSQSLTSISRLQFAPSRISNR